MRGGKKASRNYDPNKINILSDKKCVHTISLFSAIFAFLVFLGLFMVSAVFCIYALFTFTEFFFSSLVFPYFSAFFKAGLSLCFPHFLLFTQFFRFPDIFCEFRIFLRFLIFSSNLSFPAFLLPFSKFRKFSAVFNFFPVFRVFCNCQVG